jgi:hypothetical protein
MAVALTCACERAGPDRSAAPGPSASGSPVANTSSVASTAAVTTGKADSASPNQRSTWTGTYKSGIGSLYIPADWKNVRWSSVDTDKGIGDGTLTLEVDSATGGVQGTLEGALGPAIVAGVAVDGKLTATIVRKNPADRGFAGTLVGAIDKEHAVGTMNLASGEASAIRAATFSLAPSGH